MPLLSYDILRMSGKVIINTQLQLEGVILEEGYPKKTQKKRTGYTCEGARREEANTSGPLPSLKDIIGITAFALIPIHMRPLTLAKDLRGP